MNAPPFEMIGIGFLVIGFICIGIFIVLALVVFVVKEIFRTWAS